MLHVCTYLLILFVSVHISAYLCVHTLHCSLTLL